MDLGEKYKFGLEKRIEDHMNYQTSTLYSEWQFSNQSINSAIANTISSFSPLPPVSMVENFCSNIYTQSTNPQNPLSLCHFPIDSGLTKRLSCSEFSGDGQEDAPDSSHKGIGAKKRERSNQEVELDIAQGGNSSVEATEEKCEQNSSTMAFVKHSPKEDYLHMRARRGQATNSHSLAERARREKISERMKLLQDLVPGCSKVTGKAVMLDEIINYVQSLQRQVEFLSMKLAAVNPRLDFNIEGLLSKDIFHLRGGLSPAIGFLPEMSYPQLHPSQQSMLQSGIPGMGNPSDALRRAVSAQLTPMAGYKESASQMVNAWDEDLHNIVEMTFGANTSLNTSELIGKPRDSFPL